MHANGFTVREIGDKTGVSKSLVSNILNAGNVTARRGRTRCEGVE